MNLLICFIPYNSNLSLHPRSVLVLVKRFVLIYKLALNKISCTVFIPNPILQMFLFHIFVYLVWWNALFIKQINKDWMSEYLFHCMHSIISDQDYESTIT